MPEIEGVAASVNVSVRQLELGRRRFACPAAGSVDYGINHVTDDYRGLLGHPRRRRTLVQRARTTPRRGGRW